MGDKNIKKENKKKKKSASVTSASPASFQREVVTQPELITKKKKER